MLEIDLPVRAFLQKDAYSCGSCALSALYRFHKIRAPKWWIEGQLGVHHSAPIMPRRIRDKVTKWIDKNGMDLKGSWPPDLFALLRLDRFQFRPICYSLDRKYEDLFYVELNDRNPILCLLSEYAFDFHWLLLTGLRSAGPTFTCSLNERWEPDWERLNDASFGAIAIRPGPQTKQIARSRNSHSFGSIRKRDYFKGWIQGIYWSAKYLGISIPPWLATLSNPRPVPDDDDDEEYEDLLPKDYVWDESSEAK